MPDLDNTIKSRVKAAICLRRRLGDLAGLKMSNVLKNEGHRFYRQWNKKTFFGTGSRTDTEGQEYNCIICNISISRVVIIIIWMEIIPTMTFSNRQTLCPHSQTESTI